MIELTHDEIQYLTALVGKQPTESGAFGLWMKLRHHLEPAPTPQPEPTEEL
mgnify:CR=1 FL=1|tara:strand:+ start:663 stop:815 length:153 start_codon:yes stop_codon:yes gene_type:complete